MYIVNVISIDKKAKVTCSDKIRSDVFMFDTFDEALVFSSEVHSNCDLVKDRQFIITTTSKIEKGGNVKQYLASFK